MTAAENAAKKLFLFGGFSSGLGGDQRGRDYHSDEGQGNEHIVHLGFSLGGLEEPVYIYIIPRMQFSLNPTKTDFAERRVGWL